MIAKNHSPDDHQMNMDRSAITNNSIILVMLNMIESVFLFGPVKAGEN
jgi:hypothetical protein